MIAECNADAGHSCDANDGEPCDRCAADAAYWLAYFPPGSPPPACRIDPRSDEEIRAELRDAGRLR